jgi:hypothetical protein
MVKSYVRNKIGKQCLPILFFLLQKYLAIKNRGYTNVAKPCLYSQAIAVLEVSSMSNWRANSIR